MSFDEDEDAKYYSIPYYEKAVVYKPRELKEKLMIANNILLECKKEQKTGKRDRKNEPILKTLENFTKIPTDELQKLYDNIDTRDRSFQKALKDSMTIYNPTLDLLKDDIRNIFVKYILENNSLPSKIDFLNDLSIIKSKYTTEVQCIRRLAKNELIKYHYFPMLDRYILTEHPSKIYSRTLYIKNIFEQRKQNNNFVYIELKNIINLTRSGFIVGLAAIPSKGRIEKFFTIYLASSSIKVWLQRLIIPIISKGSIIVISQPQKQNKITFTPHGKKANIMKWLDENGIPYESNSHTSELYVLYNTFKSKVKIEEEYDYVFQNAGFEIIHCPTEWKDLNYFNPVWSNIDTIDLYISGRINARTLKKDITDAVQNMKDLCFEKMLIENEIKMMTEDSKMEEILENFLEMVNNGEVPAMDFPTECNKADYSEMLIGDFISDLDIYN